MHAYLESKETSGLSQLRIRVVRSGSRQTFVGFTGASKLWRVPLLQN